MKKYMICLFLFAAVSAFCLGVGIGTRQSCKKNLLQETSQSESSSLSGSRGWVFAGIFKGSENDLSLYPCTFDGFSSGGTGAAARGDLVFFYDGCVPLSGVLYQLGKNILEKGRQTGYNRKEQKSWVRRIL